MAFEKDLPVWREAGSEIPENIKDNGWSPEDKPAAQHLNNVFHKTYEALKELQESAAEKDVVNAQLAQISVNVQNFRAKGDFTTDSIGAINAAIGFAASKGGGVVYFPNGLYKVVPTNSNRIIMRDNVSLFGSGAVRIKVSDNNPDFDFLITGANSSLKNTVFRGLIFDTNAANNQVAGYTNEHVNRRILIHAQLADQIKIYDCKFYYSAVGAVVLTGAMYNNKHSVIANNDFIFTPVGTQAYDNTCLYLGTIGFMVYGNHFASTSMVGDQTKARALTAIEMHSSYATATNNIFDNYESPMLLLGADYLEEDENPYEVVQKVISNNIFRRCLHAITFWADQDIYNTNITGNVIYVNNIERTNHVVDAYGIAFCHVGVFGGGFTGTIKHTLISDNQIYFQKDDAALAQESYRNINRQDMSSFGIGSRSISGERVKIEDALITNNLIVNAPDCAFSFQNTTSGIENQYRDIVVKSNKIHNPCTHGVVTPLQRCAFFVYGKNIKDIKFIDNEIVDNRSETFLVQELFAYNEGGISNVAVKNNNFNTKNIMQEKEKFPKNSFVVTDNVGISRPGLFDVPHENVIGGMVYNSDGIIFAIDVGTYGTGSVAGVWKDNIITLSNPADISKFRAGNFVQLFNASNVQIEYMVQVRGLLVSKGQLITHVSSATQQTVNVKFKPIGTKKLVDTTIQS